MQPHIQSDYEKSVTMPSLIPLNDTLGASFIGIVFSSVYAVLLRMCTIVKGALTNDYSPISRVFGITCLQVYMYYTQHCGRDNLRLKIMVRAIQILIFTVLTRRCFFYRSVHSCELGCQSLCSISS